MRSDGCSGKTQVQRLEWLIHAQLFLTGTAMGFVPLGFSLAKLSFAGLLMEACLVSQAPCQITAYVSLILLWWWSPFPPHFQDNLVPESHTGSQANSGQRRLQVTLSTFLLKAGSAMRTTHCKWEGGWDERSPWARGLRKGNEPSPAADTKDNLSWIKWDGILLFIPNTVTNGDVNLATFLFCQQTLSTTKKATDFKMTQIYEEQPLFLCFQGLIWIGYHSPFTDNEMQRWTSASRMKDLLALQTALLKPGCYRKYFQGLHWHCIIFCGL